MNIEDFLPDYPKIQDSNFYQDIYDKKEFNELKVNNNEVESVNNPGDLFKHQKIISRFLSTYTPYNSLFLFHEMGSGKCVVPDTEILVNGNRMRIYDAFSTYSDLFSQMTDNEGGYWYRTNNNIYTLSYDEITRNYTIGKIIFFYREKIMSPVVKITLKNGKSLTMTTNHKIFSTHGWSRYNSTVNYVAYNSNFDNVHKDNCFSSTSILNYFKDDKLFYYDRNNGKLYSNNRNDFILEEGEYKEGNNRGNISNIDFQEIDRIHIEFYYGWVYDIEVDKYHNYVANGFLTHNTCSAFGLTEKIRNDEVDNLYNELNPDKETLNRIRGVIVLTRGKNLLKNLLNELVFVCSSEGKYIPEDYSQLTELEKVQRIKKMVSPFYSFYTFYNFSKIISKMTNEKISTLFSDHIIIIDEVHNISVKENEKENVQNTYKEMHRFLHNINGGKILLLSGTPMRDTPDEISELLNLILPENNQLPTGKNFIEEYMYNYIPEGEKEKDENILLFREDKKDEFLEKIKGIFSYLSSRNSRVKKEYVGDISVKNISPGTSKGRGITTFTLKTVEMSEFQSKVYITALKKDQEKRGIYTNSRQATLFVSPDGEYGSKFFNGKYKKEISINPSENITIENPGLQSGKRFVLPQYIKKFLGSGSIDQRLENLKKYSASYHFVIDNILKNENKNSIVYCSFVKGSGAILFSLLLSYFGFSSATGNENTPGKRYAIFTNLTASERKIQRVINRFNKADNKEGKYIRVIIFSKIASEGLSFFNVRDIYVLTPFWNYADIAQAIARGIRRGSHNDLISSGINPDVKIYQMCSLPKTKKNALNKSIDYIMYYKSAIKDISIKSVERLLKEGSIDCQLLYDVNYKNDALDFSRECDYQICKYTCRGISRTDLKNDYIDYSTYNIYYSNPIVKKIKNFIKNNIGDKFIYNIDIDMIKQLSVEEYIEESENTKGTENVNFYRYIIAALYSIIIDNDAIYNKFGNISYIRGYKTKYFIDILNNVKESIISDVYYMKNSVISMDCNFNNILSTFEDTFISDIIEKMFTILSNKKSSENNQARVDDIISSLPMYIKESLLENAIISNKLGKNTVLTNKILSYFSSFIEEFNGKTIITYLVKDIGIIPYLDDNLEFKELSEEEIDIWKSSKTEKKKGLEENEYGYYGRIDKEKNKFLIIDMIKQKKSETIKAGDKRRIYKGKDCMFYTKNDLLEILSKFRDDYKSYGLLGKADICKALKKEFIDKNILENY